MYEALFSRLFLAPSERNQNIQDNPENVCREHVEKQVQGNKYLQVQEKKYDTLSLQLQCPGQSDLQLPILKLFFVDAINRNLYIYFG